MEDKKGREYRYQVDYTLPGGKMYHVRCDDWTEFQNAVLNIESLFNAAPLTPPKKSVSPIESEGTLACETCGLPLSPEKRIISKKDGRAWWVRNCPSGDLSHKGTIRPAS